MFHSTIPVVCQAKRMRFQLTAILIPQLYNVRLHKDRRRIVPASEAATERCLPCKLLFGSYQKSSDIKGTRSVDTARRS